MALFILRDTSLYYVGVDDLLTKRLLSQPMRFCLHNIFTSYMLTYSKSLAMWLLRHKRGGAGISGILLGLERLWVGRGQ
jgi:hypothetical protein